VAILSHSGGLCVGLLTDTRRFGFSHIVSSGNEAAVSAAAFLEYLLEDPHTAIVGGFIEAIPEAVVYKCRYGEESFVDKAEPYIERDCSTLRSN